MPNGKPICPLSIDTPMSTVPPSMTAYSESWKDIVAVQEGSHTILCAFTDYVCKECTIIINFDYHEKKRGIQFYSHRDFSEKLLL